MVINCLVCGKEVRVYPSNKDKRKLCSKKCDAEYRRVIMSGSRNTNYKPPVILTCNACGKEYAVKPSAANRSKVCSKECRNKYKGLIHSGENNPNYKNAKRKANCLVCGKEIWYYPSVRKGKVPQTCSVKCFSRRRSLVYSGKGNHGWAGGGKNYYGPNWNIHKDYVRQRDNYTCQMCGVTESDLGRQLDVHHKRPFRLCSDYLEANRFDNLISVCSNCHKKAEKESHRLYGKPKIRQENFNIETPWVTPAQAAKIIGFSVWGIYAGIRRGYIKAVNLCEEIESRQRPRFVIHIDDVHSYKKRYSR